LTDLHAIARAVFDEIRSSVGELAVRESETSERDPELTIPEQPGMRFEVLLYLYDDVLNLCAGKFWGEWFPCSDPAVVSRYFDAVTGVVSGRLRIVEHWRQGRVVEAVLQRPEAASWTTMSTHYVGISLPWWRTEPRVIQNVDA
jgi:hypothetical protein